MKCSLAIFFGFTAAAFCLEAVPPPAVLQWNNGETLSGEILKSSSSDITWKTPLFEGPLQLRWSALHRIDQLVPSKPIADPFGIALRDGSYIYGNLLSVSATEVAIHSARHGDVALKRSEVLAVRRLRGGKLVRGAPEGDVGWTTPANANGAGNGVVRRAVPSPIKVPVISTGPGGALLLPYWNRGAALNVALPALTDIEFSLHSSARPDFQFAFEGDWPGIVSVETWDGDLVLKAGGQFKLIRKVADAEREVSLRICWDSESRKCFVSTPAGELLAQWEIPLDKERRSSGITLQNKGRDLSLDFLRVRAWTGAPPPRIDPKQPRVELDDGRILQGDVISLSADSIQFRAAGEEVEQSIALSDVDALIFSADPPHASAPGAALSFADGSVIVGSLPVVADGSAAMATSFADAPLTSRLNGLRQLRLPPPAPADVAPQPPLAAMDKLTVNRVTIHGTLTSAGDDWPRWLPIGGVEPALPAKALASEIKRAFSPDAEIHNAPALFYTSSGDVLPGKMRAIDRTGVEFESGLVAITKLLADDLDAVQLHPVARVKLQGFNDPGWQILKGNSGAIHKAEGAIELTSESVIGHPLAMQSSEIKFSVTSTNFSTFRLRLFCDGLDGAKAKRVLLLRSGYQFITGVETEEGQFSNQFQTRVSPNEPVPVRLVIDDQRVDLFVDGIMIQRIPVQPSARAGVGLIIEPASAWGNGVSPVSLAGFSAVWEPGRTWLPSVSGETKQQALTVPRFRRDDPPRHALLAPNGDVLRGEIEASTASHFGFRSGLENLRVPVDRVEAVIWLKKPVENSAPASPASPVLKRLEQRIDRFISFDDATLKTQIGYLKKEAPDLKFKLPAQEDGRTFSMRFGGKTIAEALDEICSMFGLRYRISGDGEIILEPNIRPSVDLLQKVYWLKPGAFPDDGTVQSVLAGKGIAFPSGATAAWQPKGGQLKMANTPANHEKLAKLLETDFGGSLGSPTHWLMFANGARLGLIVDSFDKDFVSGRHPVYGRCKAAMSDICSIRTSAPDPIAVTGALKDWKLVYAPEPVIPGSGGDSSPSIGKPAKSFKLSLLGGGDFDLSKEKGKIIVLDFWATWCGPCVQSLPGLIEAISAFPADRVKLIGVNQDEPADQVKRFLETRGWKLTVAMDAGANVARQYGVDGIPHTVIIGPDGNVAWVKTGASPNGDTEAAEAVKKLLNPAPAPVAPASATPASPPTPVAPAKPPAL